MEMYDWFILGCRVLDQYWQDCDIYLYDPTILLEEVKDMLSLNPRWENMIKDIDYTFHNFERLAERLGIEIKS